MKFRKVMAIIFCAANLLSSTACGTIANIDSSTASSTIENSSAATSNISSAISDAASSSVSSSGSSVSSEKKTLSKSTATSVKNETKCWVKKAPMSTPRYDFGSAVVNGKIYVFGGQTKYYHGTASAEVYDPKSNKWTKIKSMSANYYDMYVTVLNKKIYSICGGIINNGEYDGTNTMERYDPAKNTWTKLSPCPCMAYTFATLNGKIYAMGGERNDKPINTVECYDPSTNKWTKIADMITPRETFTAAVMDGKIWAIGAWSSNSDETTVSSGPMGMYDPIKNKWVKKPGTNIERVGYDVAAAAGKIYVMGGSDIHSDGNSMNGDFNSVEAYDPATNKWTAKASIPEIKTVFQTAVVNGDIYAIGGGNPERFGNRSHFCSSAYEYNPETNKWTKKPSMNIARREFVPVVIGNNIYAIGGLVGPDIAGTGTSSVEEYIVS